MTILSSPFFIFMMRLKGVIKYKDTKTMKIYTLFCISIILFISCSSTYYVKNEDSSYKEMNEKLEGEKVTLELNNGEEIVGYNVKVKSDYTTVGEGKISTTTIKEITINNHGTGALKGMGCGALSGFIFGGVLYLGSMDEPYAEVPLVILPALGFVLGGLFGAIHGDIETFVFPLLKVEVSSVNDTGTGYIIILWQGKKIGLSNSQYYKIEKTPDGKIYISVPVDLYKEKFK